MHQRFLLKTQMLIPDISEDRYLFVLSHSDRIRKFIENYDEIKSHITDTMDECIEIIDMLQTQLASIDDEDFKNYLINIKMIDAEKRPVHKAVAVQYHQFHGKTSGVGIDLNLVYHIFQKCGTIVREILEE